MRLPILITAQVSEARVDLALKMKLLWYLVELIKPLVTCFGYLANYDFMA